ncbi:MAG: TrmB family transcriptional regulator [Candidatus Woesearchaeota archaeon]
MQANELLESLGLSRNEAKTYLTLLKLGSVAAGPLIKELGMHRAAVYNLLDILIDKGLVHYVIQSNRKYFEAETPERLIEIIEQEKQKLNKKEILLKQQIPLLESLRKISKESQEGTIYKGKKGLKSIFEDVLQYPNKEFLVMGASGKFKEIFNAYFIHWQNRRVKSKIKLRIIYSETTRNEKREKELKLSEIRYTKNTNVTPSTTFIYGDKVAIILWSDIPLAFLMRSDNVSESYRDFFNVLWENSKK